MARKKAVKKNVLNKHKKAWETNSADYIGWGKYKDVDKDFHQSIQSILALDIPPIDFIHQFPIYAGHVNLGRYLFFYDLYKQCRHLAGNVADLGTWKGSSLLFMAKLIKLFEPYSTTQAHGFDWFQGMKPAKGKDDMTFSGTYAVDEQLLLDLIRIQKLQDIAIVHKIDLSKDAGSFFKESPHLRFKMIFIDCGIANVLEHSLKHFWPRLVRNGILIVDHYNMPNSPQESRIVEKYVGRNIIQQKSFNRQPTAFIVKEH